jgi:hypothetical protein
MSARLLMQPSGMARRLLRLAPLLQHRGRHLLGLRNLLRRADVARVLAASRALSSATSKAMCCTQAGVFGSLPIAGWLGSSKKASTLPPPQSRKMCM